jgi:hypothetical protein
MLEVLNQKMQFDRLPWLSAFSPSSQDRTRLASSVPEHSTSPRRQSLGFMAQHELAIA